MKGASNAGTRPEAACRHCLFSDGNLNLLQHQSPSRARLSGAKPSAEHAMYGREGRLHGHVIGCCDDGAAPYAYQLLQQSL